jgi:tetratricopeptide (TPR) repeat protein
MSTGKSGNIPQDLCTELSRSVSAIARHYEMVGRGKDAVGLVESTLKFSAPDLDPRDRALLMADLGGMIWKQGHYVRALALLEEAKGLAQEGLALATILYHLGELAYVQVFIMQSGGDLQEALAYHEGCLALRQEIGDQPGVTLSLSRVGVLYERMDEDEKALAYHEKAIELAKEIDYPRGMIRPYTHIGGGHRRNGDLQTALRFYQKALDISEEVDSREDTVFGLANVGWTAYRLDGDFETALGRFQRALEIAEAMDFKFAIGRAYHVLAELHSSAGDGERALEYFEKLAQLSEQTGYKIFSGVASKRIKEIKDQ